MGSRVGQGCSGASASGGVHVARRPVAPDFRPPGDEPGEPAIRERLVKREYDFSKARRGPVVPLPKGKTRITIRLDTDVLDWFRKRVDDAGGGNYQTLINRALRRHLEQADTPLEKTLRRVIREELRRAS